MRKFIQEFKTFATKGSVFDLAVGIIIGGAFGKIVTSFVNDLLMPFSSLILGRTNLSDLKVVLIAAKGQTPELAIKYGMFLQTSIDFVLIALIVFVMVKILNTLKNKEEKPAEKEPTTEEKLLIEIRDLLKTERGL